MAPLQLLTLFAILCGNALCQEYVNGECYINGVPTRCEPVRMSFSLGQVANSSSTCGEIPSSFCSRSISLGSVLSDCNGEICNAADPNNAHSVGFLTDFPLNELWWQSENSLRVNDRVVIDIPLLTLAEIAFISFDFHSIKPAAFHLERSTDYGSTYTPYHYFAISCEDQFPQAELTVTTDASVLCQTIQDLSPGSISFFPAIDRPSANDSIPGYSESLYEFTTATNIRVVLDQHHAFELAEDDPGYYYALDDINIIGSCQCFGHASQCIIDSRTGAYECVCAHQTGGSYCEHCQDFYNDLPWQRADGSEAFECKICNCNNHSSECMFDQDVYRETGDISGGVCLNCDGNTDGRQCETCAHSYYPRPDRIHTDPDICKACQCSLAGVVDDGDCVKESDGVKQPGDCYCKANVMGQQCDMCMPGYYNLTAENPEGCQACNCSINGSSNQTCNHLTGACECKPNVIGLQCDACRENYYQPDPNEGCLPCDCNLGGSISTQCDILTGQCDCREGITGRKCSQTIPGKFFPTIDYLRLEGEFANSIPPSLNIPTSGEGEQFTGTGYYRVVEGEGISNLGTLYFPVSGMYEVLFRYNLMGALVWNTVTLTIRVGLEDGTGPANCDEATELPVGDTSMEYLSWNMGSGLAISKTLCFRSERSYTFIISEAISGQATSPTLDIDSLVAIPVTAPSLAVFNDSQLVAEYRSCVDSRRRVPTIGFAEPACEQITFTFSTAIYNGAQDCDCDPDGSLAGTVCNTFGGQCVCLPGVQGRRCDECQPGTYNFAPTGCTSCLCNTIGSVSDFCDVVVGTCECLPNVAGPDCSTCETNYWGLTDGLGCVPCSCNEIGSSSLQCDDVSGECSCRPGVTGAQCSACELGLFGFSSDGCSPCSCDQAGSSMPDCDTVTGHCECKDNARSIDCSECVSGTFNLQASNPDGCQPCFCSRLDVSCSSAQGYVAAYIDTDFSNGIQDWNVLTTNFAIHLDSDSVISVMPFSNGVTILPNSAAFLQAPQQYLGNKLSSYLQFLTISLESLSTSAGVESSAPFDVIIAGSDLQLGTQFLTNVLVGAETLQVLLHESFGWHHTSTNQAASAEDMQTVLSHMDNLFITASFNSSIILESIELDTVQEIADFEDPAAVTWVEVCDCPLGYSGLSCQECSVGYTRSISGTCEPCQCNGFTDTCDPDEGICTNCTGSTTGASCEQCLPGTYGDPTMGIACLPCPCPLTTLPGQFTMDCILLSLDTIICLNCPMGHTGDHCEFCSAGYFGDPTGENGSPTGCSDCLCNGNIDSSLPNSCNTTTGICLGCINNTAGTMCERCEEGYYGEAIFSKNCTACNCNPTGSVDGSCDHQTGQCLCLPNVERTRCEQCFPGYFGFNSGTGCSICNCNLEGSLDNLCEAETGQCSCKAGVTGYVCDQCEAGFFGLSRDGCQACNCSATNSMSTCDSSGICLCEPGSTGINCETCIDNYFQDFQGCKECPPCYQELSVRADNTFATIQATESTLFNLLIETSPYDPRLNEQQDTVSAIANLGQIYSQQHDQLQIQVADITTAINETIRQNVVQLEISLQLLKTISTPVFIQALAAEELLERTLIEFNIAQETINLLANFYIPNITYSLETVSNSHFLTAEALQSLIVQFQLMVDHSYAMSNLVSRLQTVVDGYLQIVNDIEILEEHVQNIATTLKESLVYIQDNINLLMQKAQLLVIEIIETTVQIRELRIAIPRIPSYDTINVLQANFLAAQYTLGSLDDQVARKKSVVYLLQNAIAEDASKVESLLQTFQDFANQTVALESAVQEAGEATLSALNSGEQKIYRTEQVLENLQNYSGDTFYVAQRANKALGSVQSITNDANNVIQITTAVESNVSSAINTVQDAMGKIQDAETVRNSAQMSISDVDTTTVVSTIMSSFDTINSSLVRANQLEMEATAYHNSLDFLENSIDWIEMLAQNDSILVSESDRLVSEANISIHTLNEALVHLNSLDTIKLSQALEEITHRLSSLESDASSTDISMLYSMLNQSLREQKAERLELESSIVKIQDEVHYLKNLQSMLPLACDSNL